MNPPGPGGQFLLHTPTRAARPLFRRGDPVWWDHPEMGRCCGRVVGVWPRGLTCRRDGVTTGRPHTLTFEAVRRLPHPDA